MKQFNKALQKMIIFDDIAREKIREYNPNWTQILDHSSRILIIRGALDPDLENKNELFNLISYEPVVDLIDLHAEGLYEAKYQSLINQRKGVDRNNCNESKAYIN